MEMNRIEGGRPLNQVTPADAQTAKPAKAAGRKPAKPGQDQIEFSQTAREMGKSTGAKPTRDALIEAARRKLESGELDSPGAYERTAAKLLKSGDLEKGRE
jgi:anti-sigma28 factor (negative regulator of flagellin synthesis)